MDSTKLKFEILKEIRPGLFNSINEVVEVLKEQEYKIVNVVDSEIVFDAFKGEHMVSRIRIANKLADGRITILNSGDTISLKLVFFVDFFYDLIFLIFTVIYAIFVNWFGAFISMFLVIILAFHTYNQKQLGKQLLEKIATFIERSP